MKWKGGIFGFAAMAAGIVMISRSFVITGNAVSESLGRSVGASFGFAFIIGGILILAFESGEHRWKHKFIKGSLDQLIERYKNIPEKQRPLLVLDESAVIGNKGMLNMLEDYGISNIYLPNKIKVRVKAYNHSREAQDVVSDTRIKSPSYPGMYRELARYILKHSGKNRIKNEVMKKINEWLDESRKKAVYEARRRFPGESEKKIWREVRSMPAFYDVEADKLGGGEKAVGRWTSDKVLSDDELKRMKYAIESFKEYRDAATMLSKKHDAEEERKGRGVGGPYVPDVLEVKEYLKGINDEDENDIDVVATGLYALRKTRGKRDISLYARDMDISEAVSSLRQLPGFPYLSDAIAEDVKQGKLSKRRGDILNRLKDKLARLDYIEAPSGGARAA